MSAPEPVSAETACISEMIKECYPSGVLFTYYSYVDRLKTVPQSFGDLLEFSTYLTVRGRIDRYTAENARTETH